ncbi:MAG TPA: polyhydroxyalkanoate synthesis regulator DNA-binding domain-containing protein [Vicinamibacteria bacterium]|nr:polyhydroxyalkanoate synthesis regulator DNA-binding domain-containing protein [Vicinamibacteria bacterium]
MEGNAGPRIIKRYRNRKLYDPATRRYVTLEELGAWVAAGQEVEVQDQKSGQDTTALTLAQIMLEGIRQSTARIPRQVLARVIRLGSGVGTGLDWAPEEAAARAREEAEKIVGGLLTRGRLTLEEALTLRHEISQAVHRIVAEAQTGIESRIRSLLERAVPGRASPSLHALKGRLEALDTTLGSPRVRKRGPHDKNRKQRTARTRPAPGTAAPRT